MGIFYNSNQYKIKGAFHNKKKQYSYTALNQGSSEL